jgi:FG-GAP repeat
MRMIRGNLMVGLLTLLLCASAAGQGAERGSGGYSPTLGPWRQLAKLTEAKGKEEDWLGWSVAISKDGNTAAVGAVGWCPQQGFNGCGQGAIFVFVKRQMAGPT